MKSQTILAAIGVILIGVFAYFLLGRSPEKTALTANPLSQLSATPAAVPSSTTESSAVQSPRPQDLIAVASPSATSFPADKLSVIYVREGSGSARTKAGDKVTVHYVGVLLTGAKFDASYDRGEPFTFTLNKGEVIEGWDLGLTDMRVGEVRRLVIPAFLAYGDRSVGPIPANSPLVFEIELLKIN